MSNLQFTVLIISILGSIVWSRLDTWQTNGRIDRLTEHMDSRFDQAGTRVDRVSDDLRQFYQILGRHEKSIEILEKH